ncbi:MAG: ABC transporter substrate-binding protein [Burkholderiales bacterium]|jgi:putative ABC transport system substrate-binding protein|nr:ABC transporter substrate-binding protein [Burkholderiales bacterium]
MSLRHLFAAAAFIIAGSSAAAAQTPKLIVIANFGEHPVLRETVDGFKAAVVKGGFVEGKDVVFDYQHVNFDRALIPQLLAQTQAKKPALVLAMTTGVAQASIRGITDKSIPIVFAAVVDPVVAKVVPSFERGSETHTGASMMPSFDASLAFLKDLLPDAKRIGTLYNPAEDNDKTNIELLTAAAKKAGLELVTVGVDQQGDIPTRIQSLRGRVDAILLIQSNIIQTAMPVVAQVTSQLKIPTINTIYNHELRHQLVGFHAISYRKNGERAGELAVKILNGAKPQDLPIYVPVPEDFTAFVSPRGLQALGREVPAALKGCNCTVAE